MLARFARFVCLAFLMAVVSAQSAAAQTAEAVIAEASRAMGIEGLNSIRMYGSGANYTVGQNNNANGPWPRTNLNDFQRWIDFTQPATRATAVTWAVPVQGGPAAQGAFNQYAGPVTPAWRDQLEIWTTPWGFLKGAEASGATLGTMLAGPTMYRTLTWSPPQRSPGGQPYRVIGYIGVDNLVHRVETWVEAPIFGDLEVVSYFRDYRDLNGLKFPTTIQQTRAGRPAFEAQLLGVQANPPDIAERVAVPPVVRQQTPPAQPSSDQKAPRVMRINRPYNAHDVEFSE
jgi:hypothetical protein